MMKKQKMNVYVFKHKCCDCGKVKDIYYTLSDFGDAPTLKKCKNCGTYYRYDSEEDAYMKPIEEKLEGLSCSVCGANLKETLCFPYEDVKCRYGTYKLDNNFAHNLYSSDEDMVQIEVFLIYS